MVTARALGTAVAVLGAVALSGCSSLAPDGAAAGDAALAFHDAQGSGDGALACDFLSEATRAELEQSSEMPCDSAILEEDIPSAEQVVDVAAYGRNARVALDGDVVFLSVAGGEWKVIAAGCQPRVDEPYDCSLTGS